MASKPSELLKRMDKSLTSATPVETSPDAREGVRAPSRAEREHGAEIEPVKPTRPARASSGERQSSTKAKPKAKRAPAKRKRSSRVAQEGRLPRRLPGPKDKVRFSLDLDPEVHRRLKEFSLFEAEIDAAVVGRVLVDLLDERPELREEVIERVLEMKREYLRELEGE